MFISTLTMPETQILRLLGANRGYNMDTLNKRKVGRPIEKKNRVKIGLSIDGETNDILAKLSADSGKTKSKIQIPF